MSEYRYVIQDDDDITHAANRLSIITTKAPVSAGEIVMWPDTFPVTGRTEHAVTMHAARVVTVCHVHGAYAAVLRVKVCPLPYNPAYTLSCAGLPAWSGGRHEGRST